ncbi:MAG TPA: hypothetical protein VND64_14380 [Pirellulales bacterium]|nr:hypothetical protein [Pirellulales bacterium]
MSIPSRAHVASLCAALICFVVVPRLALAQESVPHLGEKEAAIEAALSKPTSFDFAEKPLGAVVVFLEQEHQLQIQFDATALTDAGIDSTTTITRRMHDVKLRSALDLLLRDLELTYVVCDEVLLITTKSEAEGMITTRVYPVADLLAPRDDGVLVSFRTHFGELIELIESSLEPDSWSDAGGPGTITAHSKSPSLVVSQTYPVHREIAALLESLRAVGHAQGGRGENETPRAAIDDGQLQLKVYQLPRILFVAGLPQPSAPAHPTSVAPATTALAAPVPPASAPTSPAPASAPTTPGTATAPTSMESMAASQQEFLLRSQRELLKMIESVTGPNTWTDNGGQGGVWIVNGSLVVRQTGDVHRQIGRLLEAISDAGPRQPAGGGMGGGGGF